MLKVRGLNQYYGASHTLRDINLDIGAGEIRCVLGRNGVGKTTLVRSLMGLLQSTADELSLEGLPMQESRTEHRVHSGFGYVPQGRMIFPDLTVQENLEVVGGARKIHAAFGEELIFELFPVLKDMRTRRGGDLSGGQQQQLAIARALLTHPKLLCLDEPCEGIQPNIVQLIGSALRRLRDEFGVAMLLIEQKLPFAREYADTFSLMDRGTVVAEGPMEDLDKQLVQRHLGV
ncbi:MAG: urea ABC transporter ATP-binding subunit UrtE [Pseudomonadota bacterium]